MPTTSSSNAVGPVVGRIWARATHPEPSRNGAHSVRSANDRSASSCQSDTSACSQSMSRAVSGVYRRARSVSVATPHLRIRGDKGPARGGRGGSWQDADMPEVCDPLARLRAAAAAREAAGLGRALRPRPAGPDPLTDLASNDYLGLAKHPLVIEGAVTAAGSWGTGATGSRLVTGSTALHDVLERALADYLGAEAALVFSSGYLANLATITALAAALAQPLLAEPAGEPGRLSPGGTLVVSDEYNHASLVDACRLARARVEITGHQDPVAVAHALADRPEPAAIVVTESAFSVGGHLAPLAEL